MVTSKGRGGAIGLLHHAMFICMYITIIISRRGVIAFSTSSSKFVRIPPRSSTIVHPPPAPSTPFINSISKEQSWSNIGANLDDIPSKESLKRTSAILSSSSNENETTASSASSSSSSDSATSTIVGTSLLILMDIVFRKLFNAASISFPSSLAGCGALLFTMLLLQSLPNKNSSTFGDGLYQLLRPGSTVLAKWLPVFFVPSLVTLPLAKSLGTAQEVAKYGAVILGGFFFSLLSTSWSVLAIRKILPNNNNNNNNDKQSDDEGPLPSNETPSSSKPKKAFSDTTFQTLLSFMGMSGIATFALAGVEGSSSLSTKLLRSIFMLCTTLSTFVMGTRLPSKLVKIIHPLVTCTSLTWLLAKIMGLLTQCTFRSMLQSYKTGSLITTGAGGMVAGGAGDLLLFLLGPAVVALACQMYDKKDLIRSNIAEVTMAIGTSSIGGLFGTAFLVRLLRLSDPILRLSLLSRNITSPLAMAIATMIGADVSIAVSTVVVTGVIGANFGSSILNLVGIRYNDNKKDDAAAVARGLGIGAAAHGLGTAAFANEEDAFPFAAISMALTASATTILVSIPMIQKVLLKIALG